MLNPICVIECGGLPIKGDAQRALKRTVRCIVVLIESLLQTARAGTAAAWCQLSCLVLAHIL